MATKAVVLWINIAATEVQEVGVQWIVRRTWPEDPERSLTDQRAVRVNIVAIIGKVERTRTQLGRSSTIIRNTIGSSDEGNKVVFGGEGPAFGADGAGSITAGSRWRATLFLYPSRVTQRMAKP